MKTYSYSQLPAATIDFLKRLQRDEAKGDAIVVSISSKAKFVYWLMGGALLLLSALSCLYGETSWWEIPCGFIGACAGIYCVVRGIWEMMRQVLHEFRDGLYITRLHVIRTDPLGVHVASLTSISDITFEENLHNGQYSWTGVSFSYGEHERGTGTINDRSLAILVKERLQGYLDDLKNAVENANADYFASNDLFAGIPESPAAPDSRVQKRIMSIASIVAGIILSAILYRWNSATHSDPFPWADPDVEEQEHGESSDAKRTADIRKDIRTVKEMDHAVIPGPEPEVLWDDLSGGMAVYCVTNALPNDIYVLMAGSKYVNKVLVKKDDSAVMVLPTGDYERCVILREKFRRRPRPAYTKCRFDAGMYSEGFVMRTERKVSRWGKQGKTDWHQERPEEKMLRESQDFYRRLEKNMKNIRPMSIDTNQLIKLQSFRQSRPASRAGTNVSEGASRKFNEKGVKARE